MVESLATRGEVTLAIQFAPLLYPDIRALTLLYYLQKKDQLSPTESEAFLKKFTAEYSSDPKDKKIRKTLAKADLTFNGSEWQGQLRDFAATSARAETSAMIIFKMIGRNKPVQYMVANQDSNFADSLGRLNAGNDIRVIRGGRSLSIQYAPKNGDATQLSEYFKGRLHVYTQPGALKDDMNMGILIARSLYHVSCELIALNAPTSDETQRVASIYGRLAVLEAERQPSTQHHHMVDFYSRKVDEKAAAAGLAAAINTAKGITDPIQQYDALQRIYEFTGGGWFDVALERKQVQELLVLCEKRLQHPLLRSIIGLPVQQ